MLPAMHRRCASGSESTRSSGASSLMSEASVLSQLGKVSRNRLASLIVGADEASRWALQGRGFWNSSTRKAFSEKIFRTLASLCPRRSRAAASLGKVEASASSLGGWMPPS